MADITPNVIVSMPAQLFTLARSFKANANGKIYIGLIDTDPTIPSNQIQVYLENEDGSHVPVAQPILINAGGYPVYNGQIAKFVTVQGHSMAIYDAMNVQQFYFSNVLKYDPDQFADRIEELIGSRQLIRMSLSDAKAYSQYENGQSVFITDIGYLFKFNPERNLVPGQPVSVITVDDELHQLVTSGGMLEFDDYEKLRNAESRNYAEYQALMRTNKAVAMINYGDSITWGQRPDFGQYPLNYPAQIAQTMTSLTQSAWSSQNMASPGDTAMVNYRRTMQDGTIGVISTIMLGVNDIKVVTNNGSNPENAEGDALYGVKNYSFLMRKFIAREILRGRCVTVFGTTQWVSAANASPMGNLTECYLSRSYDAAAKEMAEEFGCAFVDTKRDIIQQFGISESCHDGLHLREDFLPIIGKRFAAFFMQQDYKNPCILATGDVMLPAFFFQPVSSNRTITRSEFTDGSSPPLGGGTSNPEDIGVLLPNDATGGSVTMAFFLNSDSAVIYPSINSNGTPYSFNLILDNGAKQPDYPSDVEIIPVLRDRQYILSGRSISGSAKKNRTTEDYSQINTACYMHVTTRGWHMITFAVGQNAGVAAVEGLVCDSWSNVKNNDVQGGVSGRGKWTSSATEVSGKVLSITRNSLGVFSVTTGTLVPEGYRVEIDVTPDFNANTIRTYNKSGSGFSIAFMQAEGSGIDLAFNPYDPASFIVRVLGGR
ncbi:phage tailspike protein [Pectobacterium brasiliense]|uniref:phage tailspike protein n=1 Tax=Pectobacterium brasiliense TaxID=180957 RepID=UPI00068F2473|nr:phage tailspike protein [Pectobacterium brasiliense]